MPLLWNDSLALGIRQIDLQHRELIDLINEIETASLADDPAQLLDALLPRFRAYALFHFGTEEVLMGTHPPAHVEAHRHQHADFVRHVARLRVDGSRRAELAAFVDYLKRWLVEHIMGTDREMARHQLERDGAGAR